jgi:hypothetical protein
MFRSIMDEQKPSSADFYREKSAEIRRTARAANSPKVAADLLDIAERFERMAAYVQIPTKSPTDSEMMSPGDTR